MNTKEHPHAIILRAIADGKEIQVWSTCNEDWLTCDEEVFFSKQQQRSDVPFRIKPEVKTGWIALYENTQPDVVASATHVHPTKEEAIKWANRPPHTVIQISYTPGEGLS